MKNFPRYQAATAIAILFHVVGLIGLLFFNRDIFAAASIINQLLMFGLLLYTQRSINKGFVLFFISCFIIGIIAEISGTSTGILFGNYIYGSVLGPAVKGVPLLIGINWFIIMYCCGVSIHLLLNRLLRQLSLQTGKPNPGLKLASVLVDGSLLAVLFDWIMEPVAVKLGYWQWDGFSGVPVYNYVSWFIISSVLMTLFYFLPFNKQNKFAVNLLLIQMMFFLILRTFL